jgi:DNA-binding NarL/FixJ family response regulator
MNQPITRNPSRLSPRKEARVLQRILAGDKMTAVAQQNRLSLSTISKIMSRNGFVRTWAKKEIT